MYSSFDMPSTFKFPCTRKTPYDGNHDTTYLYNTYYQWVSIFLAFQAGLFYIPRCIWLIMEGGLMAFIVNGMKIIIIIISKNLEFLMSRKKLTTLFGSFLWTFRTIHRLYTYKTTGSLTKTIISIIYRTEFLFEYFIQFCFVLQFSISFSVPPICVIFPRCVFVKCWKSRDGH